MNISVIGTGYVGLVQGVILADFGLQVICMDVDQKKIDRLNAGDVPIYEPGLSELMHKNVEAGRLRFSSDMKEAVESADSIFIAVGTPPADDGSADLRYVLAVAKGIGEYLNGYKVIVDKSTVPVGTARLVGETIQKELDARGVSHEFDVASNPEFLREGKAVNDCQRPDRIVLGCDSERAKDLLKKVYNVLYINQTPFIFTEIETAELIKYASNAFLAVKISFINEIALLAEKVGANVQEVARAMGMDGRISPKFLHAGPGYGGSCFPKDTKAVADIARKHGEQTLVIEAAIQANEKQKAKMIEKITDSMDDVKDKTIAVLGLSFKPDTDDMRDAPALTILEGLAAQGAQIKAYCPQGIEESKWRLADIENQITYCHDEYEAAKNADALVILTEWNQFRGIDLERMGKLMKGNFLFDLRNIFAKDEQVRKLFQYRPVGRT
ncbi:UDP-glucose/GDP-mannose dehydrogenase family protein [Oceanispirochaeta crateris]|uniref:UDP-glucose 6-dehydrogenase n=1 Tax=Oceanispirochaeta crateris TaxID=2518645 RepID=A0A5C1QFW4_9SPIO|nr:UDP-glucose/GDP-mannose dehydrogenase family protein [Oceanispirochaeta crateris]QEN06955.1 UDP-glucose/GDP-mannose dehydrogenase family protein [Oceanispirochaeta crateris]